MKAELMEGSAMDPMAPAQRRKANMRFLTFEG